MHLIGPLAAGVAGCESGTFDIVLRGTSTPANYYTDFEGLTSPIVGTGVALDARGGGVFYVNALVKVTAKNSSGTTIREFIAGDASTCVEVRSDSFTGTHYQSGAVAAGNPTTLATILDKWDDSAGADDWKVSIAGVATNLSTAFGALQSQRRYVVTEYGAAGDGVTDCTSAVNAAISAANTAGGGIVYFPPGTFLCGVLTAFATVSLEGAGPGLTNLKIAAGAGANALISTGPCPYRVSGFTFTHAASAFSTTVFNTFTPSAGTTYYFEDLVFTAGPNAFSGIFTNSATAHTISVSRCSFTTASAGRFVQASGAGGEVVVRDCKHVATAASGVGVAVVGGVASLRVANCSFDSSAVTSGTHTCFSSSTRGLVTGCEVLPPTTGATWLMFSIPSGSLVEFGNTVRSTAASYSSTYQVYSLAASANTQLGSRDTAQSQPVDSNADPIVVPALQAKFIKVRVTSTAAHAGNVQVQTPLDSIPIGHELVLAVYNDTAGAITFEWDQYITTTGTTFAVAANSVRTFHLVKLSTTGNDKWYLIGDIAGAERAE